MFPPDIDYISLQRTSWRAIVVQSSNAAIGIEGGEVESSATEHGLQNGSIDLLPGPGREGRHFGIGGLLDVSVVETRVRANTVVWSVTAKQS